VVRLRAARGRDGAPRRQPAVFGYYPRSGWRVVNWLLYTYLVPAAALLGAATLLAPRETLHATAKIRPIKGVSAPISP